MASVNFTIVASDMVWQWYYDELGGKHVRELIGREASRFIDDLKMNIGEKKVFIGSLREVQSDYQMKKGAQDDVTKAAVDKQE